MILWCQTASQQMNARQSHYFREYHSPYCPWISEMIMTWLNWVSFLFICWKQWIRYWGEADVDGSCRPWTEAVDCGRKLSTVNGRCHASYPSPLSKSLNQFRWSSEIHVERNKTFVWFDKKTLNHISELLKMQLESTSRKVHTQGTRSAFISTHAVTTRKGIRGSHQLVSRAFAFIFSWYKVIIALSLCFSSGALQHTVHSSIIAAKIVPLRFFFEPQYFGPDLRLARTKTAISIRSVQNADCRLHTGHKMQTRYKMQTADRVQNADWEFIPFFWSNTW